MVGNSFHTCNKVRENKSEFYCTFAVCKTLNMSLFKFISDAVGVIEINNNGYDAHEYLHELKNSDDIQYNADYKEYKKKYALPASALVKK